MKSRLDIAREGFSKGDVKLSKEAHDAKKIHEEMHKKGGEYLGDAVFGAIDGSITTFAVVSGVAGASLSNSIVLIMGFANLLADGFSMAIGNYLSTKSDMEFAKNERKREEWEIEHFPEGEKKEIMEIYKNKGFKGKDLDAVVKAVTSNKKLWVDVMVSEELGIIEEQKNPFKAASITLAAFVIVGFIPLVSYVISYFNRRITDIAYPVSVWLTAITFFLIGSAKVSLTGKKWWRSGFETLLIGGAAAGIAYSVGYLLKGIA